MTEATTTEEPAAEYARVELMGHVCHVGRLTEVERFGVKMGRVDVPKNGRFDEGFVTFYFSGSAVYRITPCDLATVERANRPYEAGRLTYEPDPEDLESDAVTLDGDDA